MISSRSSSIVFLAEPFGRPIARIFEEKGGSGGEGGGGGALFCGSLWPNASVKNWTFLDCFLPDWGAPIPLPHPFPTGLFGRPRVVS